MLTLRIFNFNKKGSSKVIAETRLRMSHAVSVCYRFSTAQSHKRGAYSIATQVVLVNPAITF